MKTLKSRNILRYSFFDIADRTFVKFIIIYPLAMSAFNFVPFTDVV